MMTTMKRLIFVLVSLFLACSSPGCLRKPVYDMSTGLRVVSTTPLASDVKQ